MLLSIICFMRYASINYTFIKIESWILNYSSVNIIRIFFILPGCSFHLKFLRNKIGQNKVHWTSALSFYLNRIFYARDNLKSVIHISLKNKSTASTFYRSRLFFKMISLYQKYLKQKKTFHLKSNSAHRIYSEWKWEI